MGRVFASHGFISVNIGYRLSPPSASAYVVRSLIVALILSGILKLITYLCNVGSGLKYANWLTYNVMYWMCVCACLLFMFLKSGTRSSADVRHPSHVKDLAAAIAWIRANAKDIDPRADPDCMFLSGHSAGGHIVSLTAVDPAYVLQDPLSDGKPPSTFIRGVVAFSGIYTLSKPVSFEASPKGTRLMFLWLLLFFANDIFGR